MFKRLTRSLFKRADVTVGSYVALAIPEEDKFWDNYDEFNAKPSDARLRIINPLIPYNRLTGENCYIQRLKKPITRGFYQVVGVRDGVVVKTIQKPHPRSNGGGFDVGCTYPINLNNILDLASGRDEMMQKRSVLK